jgi:cholest-4-en-3-one 26-monooxygenase
MWDVPNLRKAVVMTLHESPDEQRRTDFDHTDSSVAAGLVRQRFTDMREQCPVAHSDRFGGLDYISRYEDVRRILVDSKNFSTTDGVFIPPSGLPKIPPLEYDPPAHTVLRALMDGPLNSRAVRDFEPTIEEITNLLIDDFAGSGTADLASQLTEILPAIVIGRMVGLNQDEAVMVRKISMATFASIGGPDFPKHMEHFTAFMDAQLETRKKTKSDDYLGALARGEVNDKPVDAVFVTGIMTAFMLGGHHSTATAIAGLMRDVLPQNTLRERLMTDDDLMDRVIEESLRLTTPLSLFGRTVKGGADVGGVTFSQGDRIMLNLAAANRDPRQFTNPEMFDADRTHNPHVTFGRGLHACTGQHLARAEMRVALRALLRRLPDIRVDGEFKETGLTGGIMMQVSSLPVAFTPEG